MKSFVCLALIAVSAFSLPSMAAANTEASPYAACIFQARQVITTSPAYRNGSVREKQRLLNGYNAEVARLSAVCASFKGR
jgi:hypothetical protein